MKAAVLVKTGNPQTAFELREVPEPQLKANQVLIKVEVSGLNFADVMARNGLYREAPPLPSIIGYDVVGRVEAQGADVPDGLVGKRVTALSRFGGYAEFVATDYRGLAVIPEEMDAAEAVALATQYCTAYYAGYEMVNLHPGDHVLVHAAAGGVGTALTQLCKLKGCVVIGTSGSKDKFDYLKRNGVDHIINYREQDYSVEIEKLFKGKKLDATFNSLAGKTLKKDFKLLDATGRLVCYGGAQRAGKKGGIFSTLKFVWDTGFFNPLVLMMTSRNFIGVNMLKVADNKPETLKRCMEGVVALATENKLKPHVGGIYPVEQIGEAHALLEGRTSMGKIVLQW